MSDFQDSYQEKRLLDVIPTVFHNHVFPYLGNVGVFRLCGVCRLFFEIILPYLFREPGLKKCPVEIAKNKISYVEEPETTSDLLDKFIENPYTLLKDASVALKLTKLAVEKKKRERIITMENSESEVEEREENLLERLKNQNVEELTRYDVFIECCRYGLRKQIEAIQRPEFFTIEECRSLRCAIFNNHLPVVKYLVSNGSSTTGRKKSNSPLLIALKNDHFDIFEHLVENPPSNMSKREHMELNFYYILRKAIIMQKPEAILRIVTALGKEAFFKKYPRQEYYEIDDFEIYPTKTARITKKEVKSWVQKSKELPISSGILNTLCISVGRLYRYNREKEMSEIGGEREWEITAETVHWEKGREKVSARIRFNVDKERIWRFSLSQDQ